MRKLFIAFVVVACLMPISISADEIENADIVSYWWSGNPNPKPGTEEWFFQNPNYGGKAKSHQAKKCAQKAFDDAYISNMSGAITAWLATGAFSLAGFTATFGSGYLISYASCLYKDGVRWINLYISIFI